MSGRVQIGLRLVAGRTGTLASRKVFSLAMKIQYPSADRGNKGILERYGLPMPGRRAIFMTASLAALLIVASVSAAAVWRNIRQAQDRTALLHEREIRIQSVLNDIRSSVYLGAILSRDALLEDVRHDPEISLAQLAPIVTESKQSIRILQELVPEGTLAPTLRQLDLELDEYWKSTRALLASNEADRKAGRDSEIEGRITRRTGIFGLTELIEGMALGSLVQERGESAKADEYFRSSLAWISGISLLLGLFIAGFTLLQMRKLEHQSQTAEAALRQLSGQLRMAQEKERKSLSRELHDQVGQLLTGLRMELASLSGNAALGRDISVAVDRAKGTVEQTLGIVRNIAMLLRPSMLDDLGLTPALTWLSRETSRSSGIDIRCQVDPTVDELPDAYRTCLFRVAQEALTNILRHSGARTVELVVSTSETEVRVRVTDDGVGFDANAKKRQSLGLLGMQERVRELEGELFLNSIAGRGTTIEVRLPLPTRMEAEHVEGTSGRRSRDRSDRFETTV